MLLGFAFWLNGRLRLGLYCGAFAVLLGMAVAVPMFVPMGLASLHPENLGVLSPWDLVFRFPCAC